MTSPQTHSTGAEEPASTGGVVLVTGGASGVGRAVVERLAQSGLPGIMVDRADCSKVHDLGSGAAWRVLRGDLRFPEVEAEILSHVCGTGLTGVVLCAAVGPAYGDPIEIVETNLVANVRIAIALRAHARAGTSFAFVSSTAAYRYEKLDPELSELVEALVAGVDKADDIRRLACRLSSEQAYAVSKRGLLDVSLRLAREWASQCIRVNCVAPSVILTPMATAVSRQDPAKFSAFLEEIPFGRCNLAEEVANVLYYLVVDAPPMLTGTVLHLDGGWHAMR
jgi:NAD(P)-dependent dehydrogenase (short-subunit alcohol dehydrogenase family)